MALVSRLPTFLAAVIIAGAGCAPVTPVPPLPTAAPVGPPSTTAATAKPYYLAYSKAEFDKARAAKRPILLYFWAAGCQICRVDEPKARAAIEGMEIPVVGFRVDYDTESELATRFRIPSQQTTVILNGEGEEIFRFLGPTPKGEIQNALRDAAEL